MEFTPEGEALFHEVATGVSGALAVLSIIISGYTIIQHFRHYTKPSHQRHITRILMMCPIYAIDSWLSLYFKRQKWFIFINLARDCYEAYVIYIFFKLCVSYLGGLEALEVLMNQKPKMKCVMPFNCIYYQPNRMFYKRCLQGVIQYVIIRPLMTIVAVPMEFFHVFDEGEMRWDRGYMWTAVVNNISVCIALYALAAFYDCMHAELKPHNPLLKFISIKGIIFFTYWQSVGIAILVWLGIIGGDTPESKKFYTDLFNDTLVCSEMFIFSIVHAIAFSYKPYVSDAEENLIEEGRRIRFISPRKAVRNMISNRWKTKELAENVVHMTNQGDVLKDTVYSIKIEKAQEDQKFYTLEDDDEDPKTDNAHDVSGLSLEGNPLSPIHNSVSMNFYPERRTNIPLPSVTQDDATDFDEVAMRHKGKAITAMTINLDDDTLSSVQIKRLRKKALKKMKKQEKSKLLKDDGNNANDLEGGVLELDEISTLDEFRYEIELEIQRDMEDQFRREMEAQFGQFESINNNNNNNINESDTNNNCGSTAGPDAARKSDSIIHISSSSSNNNNGVVITIDNSHNKDADEHNDDNNTSNNSTATSTATAATATPSSATTTIQGGAADQETGASGLSSPMMTATTTTTDTAKNNEEQEHTVTATISEGTGRGGEGEEEVGYIKQQQQQQQQQLQEQQKQQEGQTQQQQHEDDQYHHHHHDAAKEPIIIATTTTTLEAVLEEQRQAETTTTTITAEK